MVYFDQFEQDLKIPKGNHQKVLSVIQSSAQFENIYVDKFDKIMDCKFIKSSSENFIQIADLCAYNVYRQFAQFGRQWEGKGTDSKMELYSHFNKIRCNFLSDGRYKNVRGCGITCLPDPNKCNWNLLDGCDL